MKHGNNYGEMYMEHSRRWEDIIYELTPWLSEWQHGMYYQHLQSPSTTSLGWFLWSFRKIDTEVLQNELFDKHGIQVTLRYQNIVTGKGKTPSNQIVRALHVIARQNEADKVSSVLREVYSFTAATFPLGIVLRFIPHVFRVSKEKITKIMRLRARQETFLRAIENTPRPMNATSWEILSLDTKTDTFGSLRQQIMKVKSQEKPDDNLFLSADTSFFRSNEVIFTFLPRHETEARAFVTNIVPYFVHQFGELTVQSIFQSEAIKRAKAVLWNAETREIETQDDRYLESSEDLCDDFDFFEGVLDDQHSAAVTPTDLDSQSIQRMERLVVGEDAETIGTLFTHHQDKSAASPPLQSIKNPFQKHNGGSMSVAGQSSGTTLTMEEVTYSINKLNEGFLSIHVMMKHLVAKDLGIDPSQVSQHLLNSSPVASAEQSSNRMES
jgi:hypothetical protein